MNIRRIQSPDDLALVELCAELASLATELDVPGAWPEKQLELCGNAGVFEWFVPRQAGGQGWSEADVIRGYLALSQACLTTTFVITQRAGATSRIAVSDNRWARETLLPDLLSGRTFATVGISHLTTSRQHLAQPVLRAEETAESFVLDGYSPWVTGGQFAQHIVVGATLADGRQILVALPTDLPGVVVPQSPELVALSASHTGPVNCERVFVDRKWLLAGPMQEVMKQGLGAKTGGLQTSTLAVGLTRAALQFLDREAEKRADLAEPACAFREELTYLEHALLALAGGEQCGGWSASEVRTQANSLVLRATQAALAAAKGAGFIAGHPAGRWCREALFFLVWSCPQGVLAANLCEFAGIGED
ncbi:MAG TPA: acyl-CoA dehydrogenase family protein [Pirellulaceae bacterium]|nr:acyl-CoA dehydrogenase family protein [Pirellulaceae bacterium]